MRGNIAPRLWEPTEIVPRTASCHTEFLTTELNLSTMEEDFASANRLVKASEYTISPFIKQSPICELAIAVKL